MFLIFLACRTFGKLGKGGVGVKKHRIKESTCIYKTGDQTLKLDANTKVT